MNSFGESDELKALSAYIFKIQIVSHFQEHTGI